MKLWMISLLWLAVAAPIAHASPSTVLGYCEAYAKAKIKEQPAKTESEFSEPKGNFFANAFEGLEFILSRGRGIHLAIAENEKLRTLPIITELGRLTENRALIYAPKPTEIPDRELKAIVESAKSRYTEMTKVTDVMEKQTDVQACLDVAAKASLTDEVLTQFDVDMKAGLKAHHLRFGIEIKSQLSANRSWTPGSKFALANNYKEILASLDQLDAGQGPVDLVLIFHATDEGLLKDESGLYVPRNFFAKINPDLQIRSLTIFSCAVEKVLKFYAKELTEFQNSRQARVFFPVGIGVLKSFKVTPAELLDVFLRKHAEFTRWPRPFESIR